MTKNDLTWKHDFFHCCLQQRETMIYKENVNLFNVSQTNILLRTVYKTYLKLILFRILLLWTIHQVRVARTFLKRTINKTITKKVHKKFED